MFLKIVLKLKITALIRNEDYSSTAQIINLTALSWFFRLLQSSMAICLTEFRAIFPETVIGRASTK